MSLHRSSSHFRREKSKSGRLRIIGLFDDVLHATHNAVLGLLAGEGVQVATAFGKKAKKKGKRKEDAYQLRRSLSSVRDDYDDDDDENDYSWDPGQY